MRASSSAYFVYPVLLVLLAAVVALALLLGHGSLAEPALAATLLELRATRVGAAFLAGAALAAGGVVLQGVFRNPLVSPSILGTTAGAQLGGQTALLALVMMSPERRMWLAAAGAELVVPIGCLAGAAVALAIVLASTRERTATLALLLTGFILSSLFLSLAAFLTSLAQDSWDVGRAIVAFTLGGVGGVGRRPLVMAVPLVLVGLVAAWLWGRTLDLLLSGEEEASTLGADVGQVRRWSMVWVAVLTAAAVSVGGNVAFVGLIAPHALRPFVGVLHRRLLPAAALLGGTFLVGCDLLARTLPTRSEIPLGVVTGLIGAPLFVVLLWRSQRQVEDHG